MRWPLIVPSLADRDDTDAFDTVHTVLGTVVGETFGYLLTALWTVLIISALGRRLAGRWFSILGYVAAALIAVGVLVPLDVPGTDFANFVGYVLWSVWMLAFATLILRRPDRIDPVAQQPGPGVSPGAHSERGPGHPRVAAFRRVGVVGTEVELRAEAQLAEALEPSRR